MKLIKRLWNWLNHKHLWNYSDHEQFDREYLNWKGQTNDKGFSRRICNYCGRKEIARIRRIFDIMSPIRITCEWEKANNETWDHQPARRDLR